MLLEQLRYSFGNLSAKNFNDAALEELVTLIRGAGLRAALRTLKETCRRSPWRRGCLPRVSRTRRKYLGTDADRRGLTSRVSNAEGSISDAFADGNGTQFADHERRGKRQRHRANGRLYFPLCGQRRKLFVDIPDEKRRGGVLANHPDDRVCDVLLHWARRA